ncbi:kelch repeat-containing protein [Bacteroidota bacterium]
MKIFLLLIIISITQIFPAFGQYGQWTELKPKHYPPPRCNFGMTDIGEDKVIIFGGIGVDGELDDTWIYDFNTNDWTEVQSEPKPPKRFNHGMARLGKNKALLFGGEDTPYIKNETWVFQLDSNKWFQMDPELKPPARVYFGISQLNGNKALIYSGYVFEYESPIGKDTWIYDFEKNEWNKFKYLNPWGAGQGVHCAFLDTGKVLSFSGWAGTSKDYNGIFDISLDSWKHINPKQNATPVQWGAMANISKNMIFLFGGSPSGKSYGNESWIFFLSDTTWNPINNIDTLPKERSSHGIAKINDGRILLFGGITNGGKLGDTWLFELDTNYIHVKENISGNPEIKTFISTNNELIINYQLPESTKAEIEIFNINGFRVYRSKYLHAQNGWNRKVVQVENLSKGIYFVVLKANNIISAHKFLFF